MDQKTLDTDLFSAKLTKEQLPSCLSRTRRRYLFLIVHAHPSWICTHRYEQIVLYRKHKRHYCCMSANNGHRIISTGNNSRRRNSPAPTIQAGAGRSVSVLTATIFLARTTTNPKERLGPATNLFPESERLYAIDFTWSPPRVYPGPFCLLRNHLRSLNFPFASPPLEDTSDPAPAN